tara:strand:+ start:464 stop:1492 length:1029 start_codon:yes stop_codon:yes gene_type:complete
MSTMPTLNMSQDQFWFPLWWMMMSLEPISLLSRVLRGAMNRTRIWAYLCPQLPSTMTDDEEKLFIQLRDPALSLKGGFHSKLSNRAKRAKIKTINEELFNMIVSRKIDPTSMIRLGYWHHAQVARKFGSRSVSLLQQAFMMQYDRLVQYLFRMGAEITPKCYQHVMKYGNDYFKYQIIRNLPSKVQTIRRGGNIPTPTIELTKQDMYGTVIPGIECYGIPHLVVDKQGYLFDYEYIYTYPAPAGLSTSEREEWNKANTVVDHYILKSMTPFSSGYDHSRNCGWVIRQKEKICRWRVAVMIGGRKSPWSEWTESVTYLNWGRVRVLPQTARIIQRLVRKKLHG